MRNHPCQDACVCGIPPHAAGLIRSFGEPERAVGYHSHTVVPAKHTIQNTKHTIQNTKHTIIKTHRPFVYISLFIYLFIPAPLYISLFIYVFIPVPLYSSFCIFLCLFLGLGGATLGLPISNSYIAPPFFQSSAKSGFQMRFSSSTLGAGAKPRLESRIQKFTPHCVCRPHSVPPRGGIQKEWRCTYTSITQCNTKG